MSGTSEFELKRASNHSRLVVRASSAGEQLGRLTCAAACFAWARSEEQLFPPRSFRRPNDLARLSNAAAMSPDRARHTSELSTVASCATIMSLGGIRLTVGGRLGVEAVRAEDTAERIGSRYETMELIAANCSLASSPNRKFASQTAFPARSLAERTPASAGTHQSESESKVVLGELDSGSSAANKQVRRGDSASQQLAEQQQLVCRQRTFAAPRASSANKRANL